jgi:hypothetical protein
MHTNSVKEQHWLQVGGFMMYSLNVILYRGYFNYYCLIILHIQKKEATDERMYHVSIWNIPGSNSGSNKDNNDN